MPYINEKQAAQLDARVEAKLKKSMPGSLLLRSLFLLHDAYVSARIIDARNNFENPPCFSGDDMAEFYIKELGLDADEDEAQSIRDLLSGRDMRTILNFQGPHKGDTLMRKTAPTVRTTNVKRSKNPDPDFERCEPEHQERAQRMLKELDGGPIVSKEGVEYKRYLESQGLDYDGLLIVLEEQAKGKYVDIDKMVEDQNDPDMIDDGE